MKEEILLRSFNSRLQYSQDQSQISEHNDNPHIYSNVWHYIFNLVGVAVGFGAFWRFPYLIYKNGGGVFIIPYTISMILIGLPILYLQIGIGQMHRVSLPFIFKKLHPSLKIVGIAIMTATFHMSSVYNILLTYCYRFLFAAFLPNLPFADEPITSSKYFHEVILEQSDSIQHFGGINFTLFFIYILSLILCHLIVKDGAKTTGKIAVYTALGPFFIFIVLVAYGFTLDGAAEGINYIFKPDWSKLWKSEVWVDANTQVFYQLSIGLGVVSNLSAMKPKREDFLKSVFIVPLSLFLSGILSALTIFMYLSHFSLKSGVSIENLKLSGPQLSFNVLPKALCLLPFPNLWLIIFFLAMILLGISSQFGVIQALYCCIIDQYKQKRLIFFGFTIEIETAKYGLLCVISLGSILFTSYAGIYYLQFFDYYMSNIPYTLWVLVQLYFFVKIFKLQQLISTIALYTKVKTPKIIEYCLKSYWLAGLLVVNLIFAIINQTLKYRTYSFFMYIVGWIFSLYPMFLIYIYLRRQWRGWQQVKLTFRDINRRTTFL